ncbi:hypothetical protein FA09DRAFT_324138 [Tilletiopsis washingtonensis]|uniref:Galactose mutarotase-like protein n=1 Tax=Tilletiopsis washingtonensis TaxID=58919 RepID=A0A316ZIE3_9BASI|nr:hypothetical protein FA09DRAFT_324138 [Tilletiopsis washingtonensis]PWO01300.1 hypothetical protein FA09DRAFT_324138 [Tilletiopsis washingtonensis]
MSTISPFEPLVLTSPSSSLSFHLLPYGLIPHRLLLSKDGLIHDLLAGPEDPADHHATGRCFFGPVIGRYANRLEAGTCKYVGGQMHVPEWGGENLCLHGGPGAGPGGNAAAELPSIPADTTPLQRGPLDTLVWTPLSSPKLFSAPSDASAVVFGLLHGASEDGPQGTLYFEVRFAVEGPTSVSLPSDVPALGKSAGSVSIAYRAVHAPQAGEKECDITPLNLTHHWAFNLSASSPEAREQEDGTIDAHTLRFFGPEIHTLDLDSRLVPTGKLLDCTKTPGADFATKGPQGYGRKMGESAPQGGHDHWYGWGAGSRQGQLRALLRAESTGIAVSFETDQSGTQLYGAVGQPHPPASLKAGGAKKLAHGGNGTEANAFCSAAFLEFAHPHSTLNHDALRTFAGSDTTLKQGETYANWTRAEVWIA